MKSGGKACMPTLAGPHPRKQTWYSKINLLLETLGKVSGRFTRLGLVWGLGHIPSCPWSSAEVMLSDELISVASMGRGRWHPLPLLPIPWAPGILNFLPALLNERGLRISSVHKPGYNAFIPCCKVGPSHLRKNVFKGTELQQLCLVFALRLSGFQTI